MYMTTLNKQKKSKKFLEKVNFKLTSLFKLTYKELKKNLNCAKKVKSFCKKKTFDGQYGKYK